MADALKKEKKNIMVKKRKAWASLDELLNPAITQQHSSTTEEDNTNEIKKLDQVPNTHNASPLNSTTPPIHDTNISKLDDPGATDSFRNNSVTIEKQFSNKSSSDSVIINKQSSNNSVTNNKELQNDLNSFRNNSVTIEKQFSNKSSSDSVIINKQSSNNSVTNNKELRNDLNSFRNNCVTESVTDSVTIPEQLRNKTGFFEAKNFNLNRLSGHRLKIVQTIFDLCQERGSMNTGPISRSVFESRTGINGEVIRVTNSRLIKEGFIIPLESKPGNGGYTIFELNQKIYNEIFNSYLRSHSVTIPKQLRNNCVTESVTDSVTTPSSKIDRNINTLTNYLEPSTPVKPTWFKELNFAHVHPIGPMQVNSSIRDLIQEKLDPEAVQQFLNKFKTWLAGQGRIQNPLAIFCSKIKEFAIEGDSDVLACMSDEERQIELQFAQELEKRRAELDLIMKSREQKSKEQFDQKFEAWYLSTDRGEHESHLASTSFLPYGSEIYKTTLKEKYRLSERAGE